MGETFKKYPPYEQNGICQSKGTLFLEMRKRQRCTKRIVFANYKCRNGKYLEEHVKCGNKSVRMRTTWDYGRVHVTVQQIASCVDKRTRRLEPRALLVLLYTLL